MNRLPSQAERFGLTHCLGFSLEAQNKNCDYYQSSSAHSCVTAFTTDRSGEPLKPNGLSVPHPGFRQERRHDQDRERSGSTQHAHGRCSKVVIASLALNFSVPLKMRILQNLIGIWPFSASIQNFKDAVAGERSWNQYWQDAIRGSNPRISRHRSQRICPFTNALGFECSKRSAFREALRYGLCGVIPTQRDSSTDEHRLCSHGP